MIKTPNPDTSSRSYTIKQSVGVGRHIKRMYTTFRLTATGELDWLEIKLGKSGEKESVYLGVISRLITALLQHGVPAGSLFFSLSGYVTAEDSPVLQQGGSVKSSIDGVYKSFLKFRKRFHSELSDIGMPIQHFSKYYYRDEQEYQRFSTEGAKNG